MNERIISAGDFREGSSAQTRHPGALVGGILSFKLLADMFPSIHLLDYVALAAALVALVVLGKDLARVRLGMCDAIAVALLMLIALNAYQDQEGVSIAIKMGSAFAIYFLGRASIRGFGDVLQILTYTSAAVVAANLLLLGMGDGFQGWGGARTFSGFYFFKTDLASAMALAVALSIFNCKTNFAVRAFTIGGGLCVFF